MYATVDVTRDHVQHDDVVGDCKESKPGEMSIHESHHNVWAHGAHRGNKIHAPHARTSNAKSDVSAIRWDIGTDQHRCVQPHSRETVLTVAGVKALDAKA